MTTFGTASAAIRVQQGARVIRVYIGEGNTNCQLSIINCQLGSAPAEPQAYQWDSRNYKATAGMFLTDLSRRNLYSTAYGSTSAATFTLESTAMNYTVPTASRYLVTRGNNLSSAALKKVVYRLSGATADQTKNVTTPQVNHKTYTRDDGSTLLYWKLDSSANARIKPIFVDCYNSTAGGTHRPARRGRPARRTLLQL